MFTEEQIQHAHSKVQSGADFPNYIKDLKTLGVAAYETWVKDGHTEYAGDGAYLIASKPKYTEKKIAGTSNKEIFQQHLTDHQQGKTNYPMFCDHCAETGVEKWVVDLAKMTCTYYNKAGIEILVETIPG